jgi:hypothetical protein
MANQIANLFFDKGTTFSSDVDVTDNAGNPLDLTDWTPSGYMSKGYSTTQSKVPFTFYTDNANGVITIVLTPTQTAALDAGRYVYNVDITSRSDNSVIGVVEGIITVNDSLY